MSEILLELRNVKKKFKDAEVLEGISLSIHQGEFITLLGPSGCGKTTTLRIIAGLESADEGEVLLEGKDVSKLAPDKRDINTVFQNYALFPHMNVAANVGYGLRLKKVPKPEIKERVRKMLEMVQLLGYEKRMPTNLSGGQKQRVAIARAIINNPKLLLLDEPLGALDLQLRRAMQLELKKLQKKLGITFIYITHDQEEAINMSDRIVVMNQGAFEQVGTPDEIYNHPKTSYVATFVGNANIIKGRVVSADKNKVKVQVGKVQVHVMMENDCQIDEMVTVAVRSENILVCEDCREGLPGTITEKSFAGGQLRMVIHLDSGEDIVASRYGIDSNLTIEQRVCVGWKSEHAVVVDGKE